MKMKNLVALALILVSVIAIATMLPVGEAARSPPHNGGNHGIGNGNHNYHTYIHHYPYHTYHQYYPGYGYYPGYYYPYYPYYPPYPDNVTSSEETAVTQEVTREVTYTQTNTQISIQTTTVWFTHTEGFWDSYNGTFATGLIISFIIVMAFIGLLASGLAVQRDQSDRKINNNQYCRYCGKKIPYEE